MIKKVLKSTTILLFAILFYIISVPESLGISLTVRYIVVISLSSILLISGKGVIKTFSLHTLDIFNVLWIILTFVVGLSTIYNDVSMGGMLNIVLIYLLYIIVIANNIDSLFEVSVALLMFGDILVFQCLQKQNLVFFWYQGITNNPNQLGVCLVAPFIACLYLVFGNNIVKQRITKILIICNAAFLLFVIWCTSSRSCLLACTVGLLIVLVYKFKTSIVFTKRKMLLFISVTFFLVLISLFNFDSILAFLVKTFLYKYGSSQNDISSNRFEMWDQVIDGSKVLGYGYTYIPCHNDYFIYVQKYGIIFSSLFYLFILLVLLVLPKIKMKTEEKIFCSIYIITCVIVSMLEEIISMFGKPLVMMMFIAMGLVIKNYRKDMVKKC